MRFSLQSFILPVFYLFNAILFAQIPLLNGLGYEYALALGLITSVHGWIVGMQNATPHRPFQAMALGIAHISPCFFYILLRPLWSSPCNFIESLTFFMLLPFCNFVFTWSLSCCLRQILDRIGWHFIVKSMPFLGILSGTGIPLYRFYIDPPIFIYSHPWGFWSGSLYDEFVPIDQRLIVFRIMSLIYVLFFWAIHGLVSMKKWIFAAIAFFTVYTLESWISDRFAYRISQFKLNQQFPAAASSSHLVLHAPTDIRNHASLALIWEQIQLSFSTQTQQLNITPKQPIHIYLYPDTEKKYFWMGGRDTMFAKTWLHQIHIHGLEWPHPLLEHELVHALAAEFGDPIFRISTQYWILPNMGYVEGLAQALTGDSEFATLHQTAKRLRQLALAPSVESMLTGIALWKEAHHRAYNTLGSFIAYILEKFGPEAITLSYAHGDLATACGKPLTELIQGWEQYLETIPLDSTTAAWIDHHFQKPSIFVRLCPHEMARLERMAWNASPEEQAKIYQYICQQSGNTPFAQFQLFWRLWKNGQYERAHQIAHSLLEGESLSTTIRIEILFLLESRLNPKYTQIHHTLKEISDFSLTSEQQRKKILYQWAQMQSNDLHDVMMNYLLYGQMNIPFFLKMQEEALSHSSPEIYYLIGRALYLQHLELNALPYLEKATFSARPEHYKVLEDERLRLLAIIYWKTRQTDKIQTTLARLKQTSNSLALRTWADTWNKLYQQKLIPLTN